jgi:hypothetical protein
MNDAELESRMADVLGLEPSFVDYLKEEWEDNGRYQSFKTFVLVFMERRLKDVILSDQPGEISKELSEEGFTFEQVCYRF